MNFNYDQCVGEAFLTAALLTASARCAEAAVMTAIRQWNAEEPETDGLLHGTIEASINICAENEGEDPCRREPAVPEGLRNVLGLSSTLRHCYVLRTLVRLPIGTCARMLGLSAAQVDSYSNVAAVRLAGVPACLVFSETSFEQATR